MSMLSNKNQTNRAILVIHELLKANNVPDSTMYCLHALCQLYEFGRCRSVIRIPNTDTFLTLDEAILGKEVITHRVDNNIDLNTSFYRKSPERNIEFINYLSENQFIYTQDFDELIPKLSSVGFKPTKDKKVIQGFIKTVTTKDTGVLGYFVFERFEGSKLLDESEIFEIYNLCQVIHNRIEHFETVKQLRDEELQQQRDTLTNLLNLNIFKTNIELLLESGKYYSLVSLDVDKFKYINDIHGFDIGNDILKGIANILLNFCEDEKLCSRISDDNFILAIPYTDNETLNLQLEELNKAFVDMEKNQFKGIKITVISGVYIIEKRFAINTMIDKANIAKRHVKGSYNNVYHLYNKKLEQQIESEKELENKMISALENKEFIPFLQPKFNIKTNEIYGAEALARWIHEGEMISPVQFIPIFEKNGFIKKLDFIIYEQVFNFIKTHLDMGCKMYPISVNVSRIHLYDDSFIYKFIHLLNKFEVPKNLIELEITESLFMEDKVKLNNFITKLRENDFVVSIDDFGTAYSSLNLLKDIDVDIIKMDKAFIDNISTKDNYELDKDKIIIKHIIHMINELNIKVIFEGIETQDQIDYLNEIGCKYGQGFYFAKPMSLDEFDNLYFK